MIRILQLSTCLAVCSLILISLSSGTWPCQVDEFYLTKEGHLAASTNEILMEAIKYEEAGNQDLLSALVESGLVVMFKENDKVQVLERSVEWKTLKIIFMKGWGPYWVKDGSLKRIECP